MASAKNQDHEISQADLEQVEYAALDDLTGVRGKVSKEHYWKVEQLSNKTGVDKGVILEAALIAFDSLAKEEKIRLLSLVGANRIAAHY